MVDTWSNGHVDLWKCVRDNPERRQESQHIDDACEYEVKHGEAKLSALGSLLQQQRDMLHHGREVASRAKILEVLGGNT